MKQKVGVNFRRNNRIYFFISSDEKIEVKDKVILESAQGLQMADVVEVCDATEEEQKTHKYISRKATREDIETSEKNEIMASKAFIKCNELIDNFNLEMNLIDAYYTFDKGKLYFVFHSEKRVDFRELVKELASVFRTRIELIQIGARDRAGMTGGYGPCGRVMCCVIKANNQKAVSINSAKNQEIALNPSKINGSCGKLKCCLNYEDEMYNELKKHLPKVGEIVNTKYGKGKVNRVEVLNQKYFVYIPNKGEVEIEK